MVDGISLKYSVVKNECLSDLLGEFHGVGLAADGLAGQQILEAGDNYSAMT
jgi:hypothetical protein